MDRWLVGIAVFALLVHTAWAQWLVTKGQDAMERLAAHLVRYGAAPRPPRPSMMAELRPEPAAPARQRFDPPVSTGEQPVVRPRRTARPPSGDTPIGDGLTAELPAVRGAS